MSSTRQDVVGLCRYGPLSRHLGRRSRSRCRARETAARSSIQASSGFSRLGTGTLDVHSSTAALTVFRSPAQELVISIT
jgi:hypothetical protein